jgi:hypothetical protein
VFVVFGGRGVSGGVGGWLRGGVVGLVVCGLVVAGFVVDGFRSARVGLVDGGVWVSSSVGGGVVGRLNVGILQVDQRASESLPGLVQWGRRVLLFGGGSGGGGEVGVVDVGSGVVSRVGGLPVGGGVLLGGSSVVVADGGGRVWVSSFEGLGGLSFGGVGGSVPLAELGVGGVWWVLGLGVRCLGCRWWMVWCVG